MAQRFKTKTCECPSYQVSPRGRVLLIKWGRLLLCLTTSAMATSREMRRSVKRSSTNAGKETQEAGEASLYPTVCLSGLIALLQLDSPSLIPLRWLQPWLLVLLPREELLLQQRRSP